MLGLAFQKCEKDAERIARKVKQCPGDRARVKRVCRKDNEVGATVVTFVSWAEMSQFRWARKAVIDG